MKSAAEIFVHRILIFAYNENVERETASAEFRDSHESGSEPIAMHLAPT